MARAPARPRGPGAPPPPPPGGPGETPPPAPRPRRRSHAGRVVGAALAIASAVGVGHGLLQQKPHPGAGPSCGGTERWNVKVANDADAKAIDPNAASAEIADLNKVSPGPLDQGGRMDVEKKEFTVKGYLAFFKHEADGDYHVVLTDQTGQFTSGKTQPSGHSMVVELPDPGCFAGKSGTGSTTSQLGQAIAEARTEFEDKTRGIVGGAIAPKSIPVTVTGVAFFDFDHGQTGRSTPHPGADGQQKVIELHPVTAISFDNLTEPD
jgi:hypothetical protein